MKAKTGVIIRIECPKLNFWERNKLRDRMQRRIKRLVKEILNERRRGACWGFYDESKRACKRCLLHGKCSEVTAKRSKA